MGTWENDEEWNGYGYDVRSPKTSYVKFVNGKCLNGIPSIPSSLKPCNGEYHDYEGKVLGKIVNGEKVKIPSKTNTQ